MHKEFGACLKPSPYNAAHRWVIVSVACLVFLLIVAGGLVTSNNAGPAVLDWPTASLVATTVAHMGTGALMLAVTAILTIQVYRYSGRPAQLLVFDRRREVASA